MIEGAWLALVKAGEVGTATGWVRGLPPEVTRESPTLSVYLAWGLLWEGRMAAMAPHLDDAERALVRLPGEPPPFITASIALLRSLVSSQRGEFAAAATLAARALAIGGDEDRLLRGAAGLSLGAARLAVADLAGALSAYEDAAAACWAAGNAFGGAQAAYSAVRIWRALGHPRAACATCERTLRLAAEAGHPRSPALGRSTWAWPRPTTSGTTSRPLAATWNRLSTSAGAAATSASARWWRQGCFGPRVMWPAPWSASRRLRQPWPPPALPWPRPWRRGCAHASCSALGRIADAVAWADEAAARTPGAAEAEAEGIAVARVRAAAGRPADAIDAVSGLLRAAEASGRAGSVIEILALRAVVLAQAGRQAMADLARALALAEPEGYVRLFVDEGPPMARLLAATGPLPGASNAYVARLLAAFALGAALAAPSRHPAPLPAGVEPRLEPLTERELEVLALVAQGHRNQEIAATLFIALGTVKVHTHSIYGKLGARNRVEALARARSSACSRGARGAAGCFGGVHCVHGVHPDGPNGLNGHHGHSGRRLPPLVPRFTQPHPHSSPKTHLSPDVATRLHRVAFGRTQ